MFKKSAEEEAGEKFGESFIKKANLKYKGDAKKNFYKGLFSAFGDRENIKAE